MCLIAPLQVTHEWLLWNGPDLITHLINEIILGIIIQLLIGDNLQKLGINLVLIFRVLPVMVEDDQPNQLFQLFNQLMKLFDQCNHYLFVLISVTMLPMLMGNHHTNISGQNPDRWLIINESSSKCSMKCKTGWLYFLPSIMYISKCSLIK